MKFWIKKENDNDPVGDWGLSNVFTINRDSGSTLFSSLPSVWYHMGKYISIAPLYEDLYIIALSIFGIDKRYSRNRVDDSWTRDIEVSIPVLEIEKWRDTEKSWNTMLSFLTGDNWNVRFRETNAVCSRHRRRARKQINTSGFDCVCLFSGGLDSFCGAIKLLEEGRSPCLVGHNEYPKLRYKQEGFASNCGLLYPEQCTQFIGFTAGARAPVSFLNKHLLEGTENTSRGRSLLFLSFALTIAGIIGDEIPVYVPENGFIGLNVALTPSRKGSCSTRTTHPFFLRSFRSILLQVGIRNPIENFFAFKTKREIVRMVKDTPAFRQRFFETISCSHPCQARYNRSGDRRYPINCGYCYPCVIRKSSLIDIVDGGEYSFTTPPSVFLSAHANSEKSSDLNAILSSVYRYMRSDSKQLRRLVNNTGPLTADEIHNYERLYRSGMEDIIEFLRKDPGMEKYLSCPG